MKDQRVYVDGEKTLCIEHHTGTLRIDTGPDGLKAIAEAIDRHFFYEKERDEHNAKVLRKEHDERSTDSARGCQGL
jgi:hypothetical protein